MEKYLSLCRENQKTVKRLIGLILFSLLTLSLAAHEIDSLYGVFLSSKGDHALMVANQILAMADDTASFTSEASTETMNERLLKTLIFWHFDRAEMVEVIDYSNKAIGNYRERDDLFNMAGCYNTMGVAYQRMGRLEEAIDSYNHCSEMMHQLNEQEPNPFYQKNIRYTINNMAAIYSSMGELDRAEEMTRNCINMMDDLVDDSDYQDMATYLQNLAGIYLSQSETMEGEPKEEKIAKAVEYSERALDYSLSHNDRPGKVVHRRVVAARAYFAANRKDEAFAMLDEALQSAKDEEQLFLQTDIELLYGRFYSDLKQYRESAAHYQNAIALSKEGSFDESLLNAYKGTSDAMRQFDPAKALDYYEQSVALKDSIFNENQQRIISDYQVKYDMAEKDHQLEIQQKNNRVQALEITILFVVTGLLVVIMVILVRLIRVRKKQNQTLARLNDTQNRILSVASHDVKNSVLAQNMVLTLANEHFDNMSHEEIKEKLVQLKSGSDELKDKLYTILHWIYGELGKETNPPVVFNLLQCVEEGIKPHEDGLKVKDLAVITDLVPHLQCCDKVNVVNLVFQNLLTNAIKFSKKGGEIIVKAVEEEQQVWLEVTDHGVGISPLRMKELMYDTVKPTQGTYGERGTGIGLYVSRQLMVRNGGQLLIDSVEGEGTTIRFTIKKPKR